MIIALMGIFLNLGLFTLNFCGIEMFFVCIFTGIYNSALLWKFDNDKSLKKGEVKQ